MSSRFEKWIALHGLQCMDAEEEEQRFQIFRDNLQFIDTLNSEGGPYKQSTNKFADLTNDEFRATHMGFKAFARATMVSGAPFVYANVSAPASMDLRAKGAVTPLENQGLCDKLFNFPILSMACRDSTEPTRASNSEFPQVGSTTGGQKEQKSFKKG
ncbi:hypothetical protein AMTR_s00061p00215670 [Amborella trichopoda]|uniref:Cathepsin propeptide inhibitor domain-containing protein n=1 Tax=Amborella trichopoda TaxID=13333 RepID=U5DCW5_AMBTC|nr:hypothetical protein AMTR_s00061p00215670 [Amborella trichopoda]